MIRHVFIAVVAIWFASFGVPAAQEYYRGSGGAGAGTGSANTFTALNKFSGGLESYENNNVANLEGVVLGNSACLNEVADSVCIGFFAAGGSAGDGGIPTGASKVNVGRHSGFSAVGDQSVNVGHASNQYGYDSGESVNIGYQAGRNATQAAGYHAFNAVLIGARAGGSGVSNQTATMVGSDSGRLCTNGVGATLFGYKAGEQATNCSNSVFLGNQAAQTMSGNNKLVIESSAALAPAGVGGLLYGDFSSRYLHVGGTLSVDGVVAPKGVAVTITTVGAATYAAADVVSGLILRDPNGAGRSDVTPTAALLLAAVPQAKIGQWIEVNVRNTADAAETITMTAGTGTTLSGTMTIAQNNTRRFRVEFTNVTAASEACTWYSLGTFVH